MKISLQRHFRGTSALALPLTVFLSATASADAPQDIEIPQQPLSSAIAQLADETGLQVSTGTDVLDGKTSQAVQGNMTPRHALREMLDGTGLVSRSVGRDGAIVTQAAAAQFETPIVLAPIVLTSNRRATPAEEVPRAVLSFDQQAIDLANSQTTNLSTSLPKLIPGFGAPIFQNSTRGLQLRGRDPLYLLDGVPISAGDFAVEFQNIDALTIEGIEVLYGPTALYGDGATGGVIQFFTLEPASEPFVGTARAGFDQFLTDGADSDSLSWRAQGVASGTIDNLGYVASLSFVRNGGFLQPDGERIAPSRNDDFDDVSLFGKLRYEFNGVRGIEGFVSYKESNSRDTDFISAASDDGDDATAIAVPSDLRYSEEPQQTTLLASATYFDDDFFGGSLSVQGWLRDEELTQVGSDIRALTVLPEEWPDLFQTNADNRAWGLRADYTVDVQERFSFNIGSDYRWEENKLPTFISDVDVFEDTGEGLFNAADTAFQFSPNEIEAFGVFIQGDFRATERLTFSAGIRYDYFEYDVDANSPPFGRPIGERPGGSGDADDYSFNVGVAYQLREDTTVFASFAQGFSLPDIGVVSNAVLPGVPLSGSEFIEPITVDAYEVGIRGDVWRTNYSLAGFYSESDFGSSIIVNAETGSAELVRAPQRNWGFELATLTEITRDVDLGVNLAWNDGDIDPDDDGDFDPVGNLGVQPLTATLFGVWRATDRLTLNAELFHIGDRDRSFNAGVDNYEIEGYTVVDAGLTYLVGPGDVSVQVTNLFNEEYVPVESQSRFGVAADRRFAGIGRRLSVVYTASF